MLGKTENKNKTKSKYRVIFTLLVGIILTFSLVRLVLSNVLATSGQRLATANKKIEILKEENQGLENQASKTVSLVALEEFAKNAGLVKSSNVQILTPTTPIANR